MRRFVLLSRAEKFPHFCFALNSLKFSGEIVTSFILLCSSYIYLKHYALIDVRKYCKEISHVILIMDFFLIIVLYHNNVCINNDLVNLVFFHVTLQILKTERL